MYWLFCSVISRFSHVLSILKNSIPFPPTAFDEVPGDMVRKPLSLAEKSIRKARKKLREVKKLEDRLWSVSSPGICFGDRQPTDQLTNHHGV